MTNERWRDGGLARAAAPVSLPRCQLERLCRSERGSVVDLPPDIGISREERTRVPAWSEGQVPSGRHLQMEGETLSPPHSRA